MGTFSRHLQLATFGYLDWLGRLVSCALGDVLDLLHDVVPFQDLAKDNMLAIEPTRNHSRNEELRAICVFAGVRHAEHSWLGVLQFEVLVLEFRTVYALAASAVPIREVPTLDHKALDDSMEARPLKAKAFLASCKRPEVVCCLFPVSN